MKLRALTLILSLLAAVATSARFSTAARADHGSVIDLEGLAEGTIVSSLSNGAGISGEVVSGSVQAFGTNPDFPGTNTMMVFDATCTGGCTGGDDDLERPELGNVLILSEDLDSSDPDDADVQNSFFEFDFSGWGSGSVLVESIDVLDVEDEEGGARLEAYQGGLSGTLLGVVSLPNVGDEGFAVVDVGISGVDYVRVTLNGSGAIDNLRIFSQQQTTATPTATDTPSSSPTGTMISPTSTASPTAAPVDPGATPSQLLPVTGLNMNEPFASGNQVLSPANNRLPKLLAPKAAEPADDHMPDEQLGQEPELLRIPSIGLAAYVLPAEIESFQSEGRVLLQAQAPRAYAAGWHQASARLGLGGNTVLIGHHNAHSQVFESLHLLAPGATIQLVSSVGEVFEFSVAFKVLLEEGELALDSRIANASWILHDAGDRLTLVTCWPADSNSHRLIVVAFPAWSRP